jgi:hypothetical protein
VVWSGDQEVVEALPAQGAIQRSATAFARGARGGVRMMQLITTGHRSLWTARRGTVVLTDAATMGRASWREWSGRGRGVLRGVA